MGLDFQEVVPGPDSWGLARARPGSGMAWDGKVSFRVHETLLFPTPDYLADLPDLPDLPDLGKMVPEPALRPSLPHAPGVRMTVVQNKLPQIISVSICLISICLLQNRVCLISICLISI